MMNKYLKMCEKQQDDQRNLLVNFTILKLRFILWKMTSGIWVEKHEQEKTIFHCLAKFYFQLHI